jgi:hypothetical protein
LTRVVARPTLDSLEGQSMLREVTLVEIQRIFEITDRMGVHRESLVIPLAPRHPGRVRRMPNGKIELIVDATAFDEWLTGLESEIRKAVG